MRNNQIGRGWAPEKVLDELQQLAIKVLREELKDIFSKFKENQNASKKVDKQESLFE